MVVNVERINSILEDSNSLNHDDLRLLDQVCATYPWFQAARSVYLKLLKDESSPLYNKELQATATHTADRSVLFDYITSIEFTQHQVSKQIKEQQEFIDSLPVVTEDVQGTREIELNDSVDHSNTLKKDLFLRADHPVPQPIDFTTKDAYSFSEWLKLTTLKPIKRSHQVETKDHKTATHKTMDIIDQFLAEKPKIKPVKKTGVSKNLADLQNPKSQLMTETLAQVYAAQKNYDKAIQAYEILKLHHPEKSGFFADQIREIKKLQSNT